MQNFVHRYGAYGGLFVIACLLLARVIWQGHESDRRRAFQQSDKAAEILLAQKLNGPRYFKLQPAEKADSPPFITRNDAINQIEEISRERNLNGEGKAKLEKLIERLAEASSSRAAGTERVSVLRLNLALDEVVAQ